MLEKEKTSISTWIKDSTWTKDNQTTVGDGSTIETIVNPALTKQLERINKVTSNPVFGNTLPFYTVMYSLHWVNSKKA